MYDVCLCCNSVGILSLRCCQRESSSAGNGRCGIWDIWDNESFGVCCLSFITHGMEVSELFTVDVVVQYDLSWSSNKDGKEPKPSKNESNQNPGFAKDRTEPESKRCARTRTKLNPREAPNTTRTHMPWFSLGFSLNETVGLVVGTLPHFTVN